MREPDPEAGIKKAIEFEVFSKFEMYFFCSISLNSSIPSPILQGLSNFKLGLLPKNDLLLLLNFILKII
jgi:hypothetical protein